MRLLVLFVAVQFVTIVATAAPVPKEKPKTDDTLILGTWAALKCSIEPPVGSTAKELAKMRLVFEKDGKMKFVGWPGGQWEKEEVTFKLDPDAKVKAIDVTVDGKTFPSVYELDGDSLILCIPDSESKPRPESATGDRGGFAFTFKRVTDGKKDK